MAPLPAAWGLRHINMSGEGQKGEGMAMQKGRPKGKTRNKLHEVGKSRADRYVREREEKDIKE